MPPVPLRRDAWVGKRLNVTRAVFQVCASAISTTSTDVIVVGGGAAGLTAAYFAAQQGSKVLLLEKTNKFGKKILISGGTRCNVLPVHVNLEADYFTDSSQSALRAVFASWTVDECKAWLTGPDVGLQLQVEADTKKYFPVTNSARDVRDALLQAATRLGVSVRLNSGLAELASATNEDGSRVWACRTMNGEEHRAGRVVIAMGGMSFPNLGTVGDGHRVLRAHGHSLHPTYPALTPIRGVHPAGQQLAGLSLYNVRLRCDSGSSTVDGVKPKAGHRGREGRGPRTSSTPRTSMLFTHRGFSGPAVLDLSHQLVKAMDTQQDVMPVISANWTAESADIWDNRLKAGGPVLVSTLLRKQGVPQRLAEALCVKAGVSEVRVSELKKVERQQLVHLLTACPLECTGHEGYAKAEVTGGGVPLEEINCSTMESAKLGGVYLCGEIVDVFGRIGGFNFYWAWLSGTLAGSCAGSASGKRPW